MELGSVRRVAKALGGTVNDVVLATVAGGVRRFLGKLRQEDVDALAFKVMAPVSMRAESERGSLGNRVAAWFVPLPVGEPDARRRFERVREATQALKQSKAALGADTFTQMTEWTGPGLLSLGSRLMNTGPPPFHMVVTNVPGPRETLHLLGAPMLAAHPMVPLLGSLSTGIALFSYRDTLSWGFTADWDLVPDLHDFVEAVDHSFRRLAAAADA
jgi:WS/DGAT/MGAT family acyltransferase